MGKTAALAADTEGFKFLEVRGKKSITDFTDKTTELL